MTRLTKVAALVVLGLFLGSAATARAEGKKDKDHGRNSSKHDGDSHRKDKDCDKDRDHKDHCGKDSCGKDSCGRDHCGDDCGKGCSKPINNTIHPIIYHPPVTPIHPISGAPAFPTKPINKPIIGKIGTVFQKQPVAGRPAPTQGPIPTLGSGWNGFAGAVGKDVGSAVGFGVSTVLKGVGDIGSAVGAVGKGVGSVVSDVGSAVSDIGGAISSIF